ncbi:ATP-dependent Zn protease [filamentous cyanobacterium LEGE 11480]|uniref:ATP-dependent Zn protease n=1 Tax=Romeriopsis navalis LEGE 11480 TaxID=2777977 RepID=A0A928VQS0_9CYAN|nr:ATP-dependent Zn protease [Romeriopsis navalis]MBE9030384.1 ATP-dependent Zn protease [Romeriopsis navalis LEGE 11480]
MNQLSLNVLAITVFGMTLSILLGPLLHIPPAVSVLGILGVLSLSTVDAVAWESKGSTIFLDSIARFSKEHRDRVVRHEAGHFLVAQQLGFEVTDYTLSAWDAFRKGNRGQGGVQFDASELEAAIVQGNLSEQMIDRLCTVWMAGIAAEQIEYGAVEGGEDDRFTMQQALTQLKMVPNRVENKQRWATLQAKSLLEANREAYAALITALEAGASIADCYQAIENAS